MPTPKSSRPTLKVEPRTVFGRKVKKLRQQGILPANIFGKKIKSKTVSVNYPEFSRLFRKVGETALIDLDFKSGNPRPVRDVSPRKGALPQRGFSPNGTLRPVLITNVTRHPVTGNYLHADFHQVDLAEKVTAAIPVRVVGESPAVKDKGAVLVTVISQVEVKALPADLPDRLEVEIGSLNEFGDSVLVKDLKIPAGVELLTGSAETVVTVQQPKEEVEEKPASAIPAEAEVPAVAEAVPPAEKKPSPPPQTT